MNEFSEILDARGLPCPAPVIMVKKALERGLRGDFAVLVDTDAAKTNVTRFATQAGCSLLSAERSDSLRSDNSVAKGQPGSSPGWLLRFRPRTTQSGASPGAPEASGEQSSVASTGQARPATLTAQPQNESNVANEPASSAATASTDRLTLFIASDTLGSGSEELGSRLIQGFLYGFSESARVPTTIIFVNAGVRLAIEDSPALPSIRSLQSKGCAILSCGTCLEYYGLTERLAVGRPCAMDEVIEILGSTRVLRI